MYGIIISVITFTLIIACGAYIIKEMIRRRKCPEKFLEANNNIIGCLIFWGIGVAAALGYTIAYYTVWFKDTSATKYFLMCLTSLVFVIVAFILALKKVIIDTETGDMVACSLLGIIKFNVDDITLIKQTWEAWVVYAGNRKLFVLRDRYNDVPIGFYTYIRRESGCQEIPRKGYVSRDVEIEVKVINSSIAMKRNPIVPTEFKYKLVKKLGELYALKDKENDKEISGKVEKIELSNDEKEDRLKVYKQKNIVKHSFEEFLEYNSFPFSTLKLFSKKNNERIALVDFAPGGNVNMIRIDVYNANYKKRLLDLINSLIYD